MQQMQENRDHDDAGVRDLASRVVMDARGNEWVIREVETPQAWARGNRCLIFSSPAVVRRLWRYPDTWVRLSPRELLDLLGDTTSA